MLTILMGMHTINSISRSHPNALQILLYYDDVEFTNPLGSHKNKHKQGTFEVLYTSSNKLSTKIIRGLASFKG